MSERDDVDWEGLPEIYFHDLAPHCPHCMAPIFIGQSETHRIDSTLYVRCNGCGNWSAAVPG